MNDELCIITIEEARSRGLRWYFSGEPCKRGHTAERSVLKRDCRACAVERNKEKRLDNPELVRAKDREFHHRNRERRIKRLRETYAHSDSERKKALKKQATEWARANPQKRASAQKKRRVKKRLNAEYDAFLANLEGAQGSHDAK